MIIIREAIIMGGGLQASDALVSSGPSLWIIILLVLVNIALSVYQFRKMSNFREREIEDYNIRHREMLKEQREQFYKQLQQMKEQHAKELEVNVIVESQKERIEDIRELSNTFLSEIAVVKRIVNQNMQIKYRNNTNYNENFSKINIRYYEALEKLQEKRTSLDFRLSELDNSESLMNRVEALFMKTIRSPKMIRDMEDYNYISQYNDNHNKEKIAFIYEASNYLKEEWEDLYNKIKRSEQ